MANNRDIAVTTPRCATAIALLLLPPATAVAQENAPTAELDPVVIVEPEPLERSAPTFPNRELRLGREGWVALSFIITESGEVKEAMIENSSGSTGFEDAALAAVVKWRYKPATMNGKPIERSMKRSVILFQQDGVRSTLRASKKFMESFNEIQRSLATKDVPRAETLLTDFRNQEGRNIYEDAWAWWLEFLYLNVTNGDVEQQRDALAKAIGEDVSYLDPDVFVFASTRLFALRLQANDLSGALEAYNRLTSEKGVQKTKEYSDVQPRLAVAVGEIERAAAGETVLRLRGRVGTHDYWVHPLLRRSFSLGNIEGSLEDLSIRCSRRNITLTPITDEHTWTIPASYGDCSVYLKGMPGATFDFYELPAVAAEPAAQAPGAAVPR